MCPPPAERLRPVVADPIACFWRGQTSGLQRPPARAASAAAVASRMRCLSGDVPTGTNTARECGSGKPCRTSRREASQRET